MTAPATPRRGSEMSPGDFYAMADESEQGRQVANRLEAENRARINSDPASAARMWLPDELKRLDAAEADLAKRPRRSPRQPVPAGPRAIGEP